MGLNYNKADLESIGGAAGAGIHCQNSRKMEQAVLEIVESPLLDISICISICLGWFSSSASWIQSEGCG